MILSLVSVVLMGGTFLYMINRARFARTRRMALLPLAACVMELLAVGALSPASFPGFAVLLTALRAVILLCCAGAMKQDAAMARRRAHRRRAAITPLPAAVANRAATTGGRCA